jgi:ABC-type antimicrobial peptide transport system permease subunit
LFPFIFKGITFIIEYLESKRTKKGYFTFIIKNTKRNMSIQSITRVIMLVISFYLVIAYAMHFATVTQNSMVDTFKGEIYAKYAFGTDDESIEKIRSLKEVNSVTLAYVKRDNFFANGMCAPVVAIDGEMASVIDFSSLGYENVDNIVNNEILMPEALACSMGKKIGDEVVLSIHEQNTYILKDTFKSNYNFVVVTAKAARSRCDLLIIDIENSSNIDNVMTRIKQEINSDGVILGKKDEINASPINNVGAFLRLGKMVLIIIGVLAGVGILDSVITNYRQREQEFKLLKQAGVSKKGLFGMLSVEAGLNFAISISIAIICAYVMLNLVSVALLSYGLDFKLWA